MIGAELERFLDDLVKRYGVLAMICLTVSILIFVILSVFLSIMTYGLYLAIFPIALGYMVYRTHQERKKL